MLIHTATTNFLIESKSGNPGCILIKSSSRDDLQRFFGSLQIQETENSVFPFQVLACKQEFSNALILMVKEIDYTDFMVNNAISYLGVYC